MSRARVLGKTGSRVTRRSGTKALVCMDCQKGAGGSAKTRLSFRGHGPNRLARHMREVHGRK